MKHLHLWLLLLCCSAAFAQNTFVATLKNAETQEPLYGVSASIKILNKGAISNAEGLVRIENIPNGTYTLELRYMGFDTQNITRTFPLSAGENDQTFYLHHAEEVMEEVVIQSTRSSRTFQDIPTRLEFIAGEELAEKGNMKPGDIRMLLSESTGSRRNKPLRRVTILAFVFRG
ncbi:carboxypeptidase-like regulatory domain-containing protein [Leeuwenhoekiella sp. ZYFB001]|uniref:carboxypeptidase-like regulatory domain-containing protein n=1 Tax=Leeuwenhoekiella sp. ZYFB001 TaxID=2719912 RepID=UPI00293BA0CC|nr:carboxypeptidase-like regulatory domain-containing protein [Leeuwenhoekiella sp. ZYFB001]